MKKIIVGSSCIIVVIGFLLFMRMNIEKNILLELNGGVTIKIAYGENYEEMGVTARYKDKNLEPVIESDVDLEHVGVYKVVYSVKYMTVSKKIERVVNVVDEEEPLIELKGEDTIFLVQGGTYEEFGALATDNYDGDITDKVEIDNSNLDVNTIGEYNIIYKVKDFSGNENSVQRKVKVVEKAVPDKKIAVLNYHFFYEDWDENCHELLCESMTRFREQLSYLKENDYYTLSIEEFTKWMYGEIDIPDKSVLITIDDGAHGTSKINGNHLIPALEEYKMHATLFLVTGWWDIEDYRSDYLDIQSHTHNLHYEAHCGHRSKVNCVSYDELLSDLKQSIDIVQDTNSFCFPFYDYTASSINAVKEAGFRIAFVGGFRKAGRDDDKYKIPRYPIYDSTSLEKFIEYVS